MQVSISSVTSPSALKVSVCLPNPGVTTNGRGRGTNLWEFPEFSMLKCVEFHANISEVKEPLRTHFLLIGVVAGNGSNPASVLLVRGSWIWSAGGSSWWHRARTFPFEQIAQWGSECGLWGFTALFIRESVLANEALALVPLPLLRRSRTASALRRLCATRTVLNVYMDGEREYMIGHHGGCWPLSGCQQWHPRKTLRNVC